MLRPGDSAITDNLAAHKLGGIRDVVEARGARLLHLPAYTLRLFPSMLRIAGTSTGFAPTSTQSS